MNETLQEFVDSRGITMRVDRAAGVVRGVKILGLDSRNGRRYLPEALAAAARLYENAKVNVNHPKRRPGEPRDYQDRIGAVRNVTVESDGLFADFHFNPKHALAEQLVWDALNAPENVGFSHNVEARTARRGDCVVVEAITKVQSVDLVADPATTRGLFESAAQDDGDVPGAPCIAELTIDDLKRHRPDLVESLLDEHATEVARLKAEVDRLETSEAVHARQAVIRRMLGEFQLPDPETATGWGKTIVSDRFLESLLAAPDEQDVRRLVEDRAQLVRGGPPQGLAKSRPQSREQTRLDGAQPPDAKTFAESIT